MDTRKECVWGGGGRLGSWFTGFPTMISFPAALMEEIDRPQAEPCNWCPADALRWDTSGSIGPDWVRSCGFPPRIQMQRRPPV